MTVTDPLSNLPRTPMALMDFQQAWCADKSQVKVYEKSRRIGISWAEAADSALLSASKAGMDCWYIGYTKDMAEEFIRDAANWARAYNLAAGDIEMGEEVFEEDNEKKSILTYTIRFASNWKITALSSSPRNLRGKQGRIIIDEAAFHDDLAELLKAALAMTIWGGEVHIISTHDGDTNPFNDLVNDIRAGRFDDKYSLHHTTFRAAVSAGLFERVCLRTGKAYSEEAESAYVAEIYQLYGDNAIEELDVVPAQGSGAWLSRVLIESCMSETTPVIRFEQNDDFTMLSDHLREAVTRDFINEELLPLIKQIPPDLHTFVGEDFGLVSDLSIYWPLVQQQNLTLKTPFVMEIRNIPHINQEQIMKAIIGNLPNFRGGAFDGTGNGSFVAQRALQLFGSVIEVVTFSESWYRDNMPPLKAAFEDNTLQGIPKDAAILSDLRAVKKVQGIARVPKTKNIVDGQKRHGDAAIGLALAHYAARNIESGPIKVRAGNPHRATQELRGY